MEEYIVKQYGDDIYVFKELAEVIKVKRNFTWSRKLNSDFFYDNKLILQTTNKMSFLSKQILIEYQNLPFYLELTKQNGKFFLIQENSVLSIRRRYCKNPFHQFFADNELMGYVNSKAFTLNITPIVYRVFFSSNNEELNFKFIILFLILLPPLE
ncbi:MAG: hypothetical protein QM536_09710 [Chitinophagaceae bacterium]|nr:hypothetical protein [Chitinophagaceae bacterium]